MGWDRLEQSRGVTFSPVPTAFGSAALSGTGILTHAHPGRVWSATQFLGKSPSQEMLISQADRAVLCFMSVRGPVRLPLAQNNDPGVALGQS